MNAPARPVLAFARIPIEFNWRRLSGCVCAHTYTRPHCTDTRTYVHTLTALERKTSGWLVGRSGCLPRSSSTLSLPPSPISPFLSFSLIFSFFFFGGGGSRRLGTFNRRDGYGHFAGKYPCFRRSLNERCQHAEFLDLVVGLSIIQYRGSLTLLISRELQRSAG